MDLKSIRLKLNLTTRQMSRLMGINSIPNYARLEAGRRQLTLQQEQAVRCIQYVAERGVLAGLLTELN